MRNDDVPSEEAIGYVSFHTEEGPEQYKNVTRSSTFYSTAQQFCVVNRLIVNPDFISQGVKEVLLRAGCNAYHRIGIPCRIKTSSYSAKISLEKCPLLVFEKIKCRRDTGKEKKSNGGRKTIVNVPAVGVQDYENDDNDVFVSKKAILRWLNSLSPDTFDKLEPKLKKAFNEIGAEDLAAIAGFVLKIARSQFRKILADVVRGTKLEIHVKALASGSISNSFDRRFTLAFLDELERTRDRTELKPHERALAMKRQEVHEIARAEFKNLRIIEEDDGKIEAASRSVKRGDRAGWSFIYVGSPLICGSKSFTFNRETNSLIVSKNFEHYT